MRFRYPSTNFQSSYLDRDVLVTSVKSHIEQILASAEIYKGTPHYKLYVDYMLSTGADNDNALDEWNGRRDAEMKVKLNLFLDSVTGDVKFHRKLFRSQRLQMSEMIDALSINSSRKRKRSRGQ